MSVLTLAMLLVFWRQLSEGAAGCYSQVSGQGPQGLLPPVESSRPDTEEDLPAGVVPVRVKVSPRAGKTPKD